MEVYDGNQPINVASKKDDSPVTAADIAAHKVIVSGLQALDPDTRSSPRRTRRRGKCASTGSATGWSTAGRHQRVYWRNGEFTVNIALIENGKPTLGVVYAPVMKVM